MADETNDAGPSSRTRPEERTTLNFTAGTMAPLATRKKLREQRAKENRDAGIGFNHAEFLTDVREAEANGDRGTLKALNAGGTITGAGDGWTTGGNGAGQGGTAGEGVSDDTQARPRKAARANK